MDNPVSPKSAPEAVEGSGVKVICPACGDPLEEWEDDKYAPYHVACHFGD